MGKVLLVANHSDWLYNLRFELIEALVAHDYEVFFAVPQAATYSKVALLTNMGARYFQVNMSRKGTNPFEDLSLIKQYKKIIAEIDPDVVLTYTIKPNIYGTYASNLNDKPTMINVTGIGSSLAGGNLKSLVKQMYKRACKKAHVVFFQNQGNLDFFLENNMVDPNKVRLIPGSGVNLDKFQPMKKTNKDDGITRFLYIGRIMKDKGIEEYLDAANWITEQYPNTEFQILGSYEEEQYRELIENNPRVKYLGRSDDVREQIGEVDCIVHPSYHEGMSNVLLEGAAMGKPLLASNIPGCKEIVDNGSNGYLFESKSVDSMVEKIRLFLALNAEQRMEMGLASRRKVEKEFDRNLVVEAYLQAINEIIDRK
jgi:glycosyltransferase involved in cell wall biosynthesis